MNGERKTDECYAPPRLSNSRFDVALPDWKICLDKTTGKQYINYRVAVSLHGQAVVEKWRRYSHFDALHNNLCDIGQGETLPPLPPKTCSWRHTFDARDFVNRRKRNLEDYLSAVRQLPGCTSAPVLDSFLGLGHDSVSSEMRTLAITVVEVRHLSPVFNPSLCRLSTGSQSYCATYEDTSEYSSSNGGGSGGGGSSGGISGGTGENHAITHTFIVHSDFLGRLKSGETDLQVVFEDFSGKHRCGTTIDIGSLGGGWRSRPLVAARQAFTTGQMPEEFALDTWLVLSGVDDGEVHLVLHGLRPSTKIEKELIQEQLKQQEGGPGVLPWAGLDLEMMREDEMARQKLVVANLVQHKRQLTSDESSSSSGRGEQSRMRGESKSGMSSSGSGSGRSGGGRSGDGRSSDGGGSRSGGGRSTSTAVVVEAEEKNATGPSQNSDEWFRRHLPHELVDEYNYKVLDVRRWIRIRQYLLCRGERQIDRWHRYLAATKPSFHDVNGWHWNDRRLRVLTYGGIPSALCVAFHPEILTFRNGTSCSFD